MRIPKSWTFILILVALGCAKTRLAYDVDPAFPSTSYKTVAPDPRKDRVIIREGMRPLNPDLHLRAALTELAARNYQAVPPPEADLWVSVYVLIGAPPDGKSAAHREGSGEGHRGSGRGSKANGGAPDGGREGGARGTFSVIVQLEDRKTGLPVWHGEANFDHKDKAADGGPLTIEEAVHQLLQPLPERPRI
jgi:hypothetical protein